MRLTQLLTASGITLGLTSLGAVAGIGALHTPAGKPVLLWLSGGSCPIGADLDPVVRDDLRRRTLAPLGEGEPAVSRPALGFDLDQTTRSEVLAWARESGAECVARKLALVCDAAPGAPRAEGAPMEVYIQFDSMDRVVGLTATDTSRDVPAAVEWLVASERELSDLIGDPWLSRGHTDPSWLDAATLRQAQREWRTADYRVTLSLTSREKGAVIRRQTMQSLPTLSSNSP